MSDALDRALGLAFGPPATGAPAAGPGGGISAGKDAVSRAMALAYAPDVRRTMSDDTGVIGSGAMPMAEISAELDRRRLTAFARSHGVPLMATGNLPNAVRRASTKRKGPDETTLAALSRLTGEKELRRQLAANDKARAEYAKQLADWKVRQLGSSNLNLDIAGAMGPPTGAPSATERINPDPVLKLPFPDADQASKRLADIQSANVNKQASAADTIAVMLSGAPYRLGDFLVDVHRKSLSQPAQGVPTTDGSLMAKEDVAKDIARRLGAPQAWRDLLDPDNAMVKALGRSYAYQEPKPMTPAGEVETAKRGGISFADGGYGAASANIAEGFMREAGTGLATDSDPKLYLRALAATQSPATLAAFGAGDFRRPDQLDAGEALLRGAVDLAYGFAQGYGAGAATGALATRAAARLAAIEATPALAAAARPALGDVLRGAMARGILAGTRSGLEAGGTFGTITRSAALDQAVNIGQMAPQMAVTADDLQKQGMPMDQAYGIAIGDTLSGFVSSLNVFQGSEGERASAVVQLAGLALGAYHVGKSYGDFKRRLLVDTNLPMLKGKILPDALVRDLHKWAKAVETEGTEADREARVRRVQDRLSGNLGKEDYLTAQVEDSSATGLKMEDSLGNAVGPDGTVYANEANFSDDTGEIQTRRDVADEHVVHELTHALEAEAGVGPEVFKREFSDTERASISAWILGRGDKYASEPGEMVRYVLETLQSDPKALKRAPAAVKRLVGMIDQRAVDLRRSNRLGYEEAARLGLADPKDVLTPDARESGRSGELELAVGMKVESPAGSGTVVRALRNVDGDKPEQARLVVDVDGEEHAFLPAELTMVEPEGPGRYARTKVNLPTNTDSAPEEKISDKERKALLVKAAKSIEGTYTGEAPPEDQPGLVRRLYERSKADLEASLKRFGDLPSFYKESTREGSAITNERFKKVYGREMTPAEDDLFHMFSAMGSPNATPTFDSNVGHRLMDRYMREGQISPYYKDAEHWTADILGDKSGSGVLRVNDGVVDSGKVGKAYEDETIVRLDSLIRDHFDGDLNAAMEWMQTKHSPEEIAAVTGTPLPEHEYTKGKSVYGVFGIAGVKLGSYWLNRVGHLGTITKDMWVARTVARYLESPLVLKGGEVVKEPWGTDSPANRMKREAIDEAWNRLAEEYGMTPAEIQERLWHYEQQLYKDHGAKEASGTIPDGVRGGIAAIEKGEHYDVYESGRKATDRESKQFKQWITLSSLRRSLYGVRKNASGGDLGAYEGQGNTGYTRESGSGRGQRDSLRSLDLEWAGISRPVGVKDVYTPKPEVAEAIQKVDGTPIVFHELSESAASNAAYAKLLKMAYENGPFGKQVTKKTAADLAGLRKFLSPDGKVGFALDGDDIVAVFSLPGGGKRVSISALQLAVDMGGRRLDAFDTYLPDIYGMSGFKAVARIPFDESHFPKGTWDFEAMSDYNGGRPDIVFMVFDPLHNKAYLPGDGTAFDGRGKTKTPKDLTYDEALDVQRKSVEKTRESLNKHFPEKSGLRYSRTPEEGGPEYGKKDENGFFSRLERLILAKMPNRLAPISNQEFPEREIPAKEINGRVIPGRVEPAYVKPGSTVHQQLMKILDGASRDEVNLVGLEDWLQEKHGPVTRDEVLDHIRRQSPDVEVSVRESAGGTTGKNPVDLDSLRDEALDEWDYSREQRQALIDAQNETWEDLVGGIDPKADALEPGADTRLSENYLTEDRINALRDFRSLVSRESEPALPEMDGYGLPRKSDSHRFFDESGSFNEKPLLEIAGQQADNVIKNGRVDLLELAPAMATYYRVAKVYRHSGAIKFVEKMADAFGIRLTDLDDMERAARRIDYDDFNNHPTYESAYDNFVDDYVRDRSPEEGEDSLDPGDTKYGEYTIPGGKDYREIVLINPEGDRYGHFEQGEQLNIRLTTRDAESNNYSGSASFIEETQSDIAKNIRRDWGSREKLAEAAKQIEPINKELQDKFGVDRFYNSKLLPDTPGIAKLREGFKAAIAARVGEKLFSDSESRSKFGFQEVIDGALSSLIGRERSNFRSRELYNWLKATHIDKEGMQFDIDHLSMAQDDWIRSALDRSPDEVRQAALEVEDYAALRERLARAEQAELDMKEYGRPAIGASWALRAIKETIYDALQRGNDIVAWPARDVLDSRWGDQKLETTYDKVLPNESNDLIKKYGGKVETFTIDDGKGSNITVRGFRIPEALAEAVRNDGLPRMSRTKVDPESFGMQRSEKARPGDPNKANLGDLQRQADLVDRMGRRGVAAAGKTSRSWENARQAAELLREREDIRTRLGEKSAGQGISDVELTAAYSDLNDLEAALDKHEAELELDPNDKLARANLDEAMAQYATLSNQILDLTSNNGRNLAAARMFANRVNGDPQRALRQAKRIAKRPLKQGETQAITEAARKLQAEEAKKKAALEAQEEELRARIELDPQDSELHAQLAELYIKLGKSQQDLTDTLKAATGRDMLTSEIDGAWETGGKKYVEAPPSPEDEAIRTAKDDLAEEIAKTSESTALEFVSGMWRAGLLMSARAAQASLFGNTYGMVLESISAMPQTMIDAALGAVTGNRTVSMAGIQKLIPSAVSRDAAKSALRALQKGTSATEEANDLYRRMNYRLGGYGSRTPVIDALSKVLDPLISVANLAQNKTFDVLAAADAPARRAFLERHLIEQADLQARSEGLKTRAERNKRIAEILGPSTKPELFLAAVASAADTELGEIQRNVLRSAKEREDENVLSNSTHINKVFGKLSQDPIGAFILPFSKIPTNAIAQGLEYLPTGTIYGVVRALQAIHTKDSSTQYKAATALARSLTGNGLMMAGYLLFRAGMLSTSSSFATSERETQEAAGIQGGSVRIRNRWFRVTDSPASMALLLGAEIARMQDLQGDLNLQMVAAATLKTAANQIRQIPALQGINNITDTMTELGREGDDTDLPSAIADSKMVRGYGGSVLPAIVGDIAAFADPFRRAGKTFEAGFKQDTPARYGMSPDFDAGGRPLLRTSGLESQVRGLSPDMSDRLNDKGLQEAYRLGVKLSRPPKIRTKARTDRDLSELDYQSRIERNGSAVRSAIDELVSGEWYQNASDKERRDEMVETVKRAKFRVAREIRAERVAERSQ